MSRNPYLRPVLSATRRNIPDPSSEVECWIDALAELVEDTGQRGVCHRAYDLLATLGRLERARPELVGASDVDGVRAKAEALLAAEGPELAREALKVPNTRAWLEEAVRLDGSYDEAWDPVARAHLAETVLLDLDDADLMLWQAERLGVADAELAIELDRCAYWVQTHADCFLAAGVRVQAIGQTLRPDLREAEPDLAMTAEKFVHVLDAIEIAEDELSFRTVAPLTPAERRELLSWSAEPFREVSPGRGRSVTGPPRLPNWVWSPGEPVLAAAAGDTPPQFERLCWLSPDGIWTARLPLSPQVSQERQLTLYFSHREGGQPAAALAGRPVQLGSVAGAIGPNGTAEFSLEQFEKVREPVLELIVGLEGIRWVPEGD